MGIARNFTQQINLVLSLSVHEINYWKQAFIEVGEINAHIEVWGFPNIPLLTSRASTVINDDFAKHSQEIFLNYLRSFENDLLDNSEDQNDITNTSIALEPATGRNIGHRQLLHTLGFLSSSSHKMNLGSQFEKLYLSPVHIRTWRHSEITILLPWDWTGYYASKYLWTKYDSTSTRRRSVWYTGEYVQSSPIGGLQCHFARYWTVISSSRETKRTTARSCTS